MSTCKDCKHYREPIFDTEQFKGRGDCVLIKSQWEGSAQEKPAYIVAGTGGFLSVTPDFGCNQFEQKESGGGKDE